MRWINIAVITIFAVVLLIFATQNFQTVSVYFLTFKMSAPHAILIIVIYLIGMVTGGGPGTLMRRLMGHDHHRVSQPGRRASGPKSIVTKPIRWLIQYAQANPGTVSFGI